LGSPLDINDLKRIGAFQASCIVGMGQYYNQIEKSIDLDVDSEMIVMFHLLKKIKSLSNC